MNLDETIEDRQSTYGHPRDHFARTIALLTALGFRRQMPEGAVRHLVLSDWPQIMIADKLARACESPDFPDHRLDIAGYAKTWDMVLGPVKLSK